jgi:anaerobic ribonucleoside-triphosphate reductase activating protein
MSTLWVGSVRFGSTDNGPGVRTVIHLAGCSLRCPGCLNPELWSQAGGSETAIADLVEIAAGGSSKQVAIMGGEPFDQIEGLSELTVRLKTRGFHIVLYSGHPLDYPASLPDGRIVRSLTHMLAGDERVLTVLSHCDALVDGPYLARLRSDALAYRGSANQRAIDLPPTLARGRLFDPVTLDWNNMLTLTPAGAIVGPPAIVAAASVAGAAASHLHCGQVRKDRTGKPVAPPAGRDVAEEERSSG